MLSKPFFTSEKQFENALYHEIKDAICSRSYGGLELMGLDIIEQFVTGVPDEFKTEDIGLYQQLPIKGYGTTDLVLIATRTEIATSESIMNALVIELKNDDVTQDCLDQVCRYCTGLEKLKIFARVEGVLIGSGMKNGHYIYNYLKSNIHFYDLSMNLSGAYFDRVHKGYHRPNQGTADDFLKSIGEKLCIIPDFL